MSRSYRVYVECKGMTEDELLEVMTVNLGWSENDCGIMGDDENLSWFEGEGYLCGGQTEEEAHNQIVAEIHTIKPNAKVLTRWTNLDEIPYNEYGSVEDDK